VTWDGSKEGRVLKNKRGKRRRRQEVIIWKFLKKNRRAKGTCGRKPQTMFGYSTSFKCCFGNSFQQNMGLCCNLDSCFSITKKHRFLK
jgi:hypothetical protein